ncbi:hypothetical protein M2347_002119 [Chryseobacterium sp. H1D6B]|nr:hypothetical protein [Chryseobacterium sp. H1D6B]MDH6252392.1 hypothetical protein [Chryseobacterium sp. H1D6B]
MKEKELSLLMGDWDVAGNELETLTVRTPTTLREYLTMTLWKQLLLKSK